MFLFLSLSLSRSVCPCVFATKLEQEIKYLVKPIQKWKRKIFIIKLNEKVKHSSSDRSDNSRIIIIIYGNRLWQ